MLCVATLRIAKEPKVQFLNNFCIFVHRLIIVRQACRKLEKAHKMHASRPPNYERSWRKCRRWLRSEKTPSRKWQYAGYYDSNKAEHRASYVVFITHGQRRTTECLTGAYDRERRAILSAVRLLVPALGCRSHECTENLTLTKRRSAVLFVSKWH